jgi:RNA polymerase sigma-70 factor (ECF subfamily)
MLMTTMDDFAARPQARIVLTQRQTSDLIAATFDSHQRELFSFALRSCRQAEMAEDLVQEAFARLIVEIDAGRIPENIRAWLYRVIANLAVSGGRRATVARRRLGALAEDDVDEGPEPAYLAHERQTDLEIALGELDVDARTALVMAASGFKGIEIADAIGRSGNATRTMMCRSRVQLRQRLASMGSPA